MAIVSKENRRLVRVVLVLLPVALRYRSDRRKIRRAEGKVGRPERYRIHGRKAVQAFIGLGPAFIKMGQLLSARPDLLPSPYIEEFAKLQDEVPAAPFERVRSTIEEDVGPIREIFESFEERAVSGASLGQVYRATYAGHDVVVKVSRPGIRETVSVDTKVFKRLVPLVGRFIDPSLEFTAESVVDQFSETIQEEISYRLEAAHLLKLRSALRGQRDIVIPNVFKQVSSDRVLVMEYIGGMKVTDIVALDEAGIDRKRLARRLAKLFLGMLLSEDIFHADPHPGNIAITRDAKIVLYDFGMMGRLDSETRAKLIDFYAAMAQADSSKMVEAMLELGILQPTANRYVIRRGVDLAVADMQGKKVEETEVKAFMEVANRTIYQFPFKLPRNLVLYLRMFSILEGVCVSLDPDFRFIKLLRGILEDEGLLDEAYRRDLSNTIHRVLNALDASIDTAPMVRQLLEDYRASPQGGRPGGRRRSFFSGVAAGLGVAGVGASLYLFDTTVGKVGLFLSAVLLAVSVAADRYLILASLSVPSATRP